jgi:hypothetical protein
LALHTQLLLALAVLVQPLAVILFFLLLHLLAVVLAVAIQHLK